MTELDQLRAKLAEAQAENERLKTIPMKYRRMAFNAELQDENKELRTALAAAQAREEKLREGISVICGPVMCAYTERQRWEEYQELIAQPRDDSALREMISGVYEECAKIP